MAPCRIGDGGIRTVLLSLSEGLGTTYEAWQWVGVSRLPANYTDLRFMANSIECQNDGGNPYSADGCLAQEAAQSEKYRPKGSLFNNYPRAWLGAGWLGLSHAPFPILASHSYLDCRSFLFHVPADYGYRRRHYDRSGALSSVLLGLERGNCDLVIFFVWVFTILGTASLNPRARTAIRIPTVLALTILKLFPVAMVAIFARSKHGWVRAALVAARRKFSRGSQPMTTSVSLSKHTYVVISQFWILNGVSLGEQNSRTWCSACRGIARVVIVGRIGRGRRRDLVGPHKPRSLFLPEIGQADAVDDLALSGLAIFILCFLLGTSLITG